MRESEGGGDYGDGGVACNVIPVNHTYINICTIKSILVNNTAEDANTNKQTHSKTKTFVLVHLDMQATRGAESRRPPN